MKKITIVAVVLALAATAFAGNLKFNQKDTTHTQPLSSVLEDSILAHTVRDAYPVLTQEGFQPVPHKKGYWKRDTDNVTLIIETRQEEQGEVVSRVTVQP